YRLTRGTAFQQAVWLELLNIPSGQTISYQEMAARVGSPKGQQAVGQALSKNPLPIILPCHRVTQKDGKLGGFSGKDKRTDIKRAVLDDEIASEISKGNSLEETEGQLRLF
ncbi:MAG: MGMT family protein, partial [Streptococcaceae bacterium]|nr:MGMT family protein [Streptococcaceae bacterium]